MTEMEKIEAVTDRFMVLWPRTLPMPKRGSVKEVIKTTFAAIRSCGFEVKDQEPINTCEGCIWDDDKNMCPEGCNGRGNHD